ncbi:MAG TPA: HAMP domain-containing sensor histidine kinase [Dehalococcoidia bacterium]|nr:HAMP domain-containing sensor histidine kinase [Dehalococcoidia bacterium]
MPLKYRLTGLYFIIAMPLLIALGCLVYLNFKSGAVKNVDQRLEARAQAAQSVLNYVSGPLTEADIAANRAALDRLTINGDPFILRSDDGRILFSSGEIDPSTVETLPKPGSASVRIGDSHARTLIQPIEKIGSVIGYVETRASLADADSATARLRRALLLGGASVLLVTGLAAFIIAARAVDPVVKVTQLAREIERTVDFTRRLPEVKSAAEMAELVSTFNALIERIDHMVQMQRDFLADSSHELRRPLTILRTNIDIMNDPRLTEAERKAIEDDMRYVAQAMGRLIADLLILTRDPEQGYKFRPVDVSLLCREAVSLSRNAFPGHQFATEIEEGLVALGDAGLLARLVENLLQNSASYSAEDRLIVTTVARNDADVVVEIEDCGIGMSEDELARAFDRFSRGDRARTLNQDGSGLGLAIAKQVAEAHGGSIRLESRLGSGTKVVVRLPLLRTAASIPA